jgi:putative peptide zinc metalloprotease protein
MTQLISEAPEAALIPAASSAPPSASQKPPVAVPTRAVGVELLGQYQGSGYRQPPWLVRRGDGQTVQTSRLLYQVLTSVDGRRDSAGIAAAVSAASGRSVSAENVDYLLDHKLRPLGLLASDRSATAPTANPLLALQARRTLVSARGSNAAALVLRPLFRPVVVVAVLVAFFSLDYWVFVMHGLGAGLGQLLRDPPTVLVLLGLTLAGALFHECGHAAACRYGGARPGKIGVGIYIVWPAFFTNVTDSYRLSRAGRLRTDLGGLYFHAVFIVGLAGLYNATGAEVLLLAIASTQWLMIEQLLPFVRFDGYFILSDLVGVPDLFARVGPILRSVRRPGRRDPRVAGLRRGVRVVVTAWVICVLPLLTFMIGMLLLRLPGMDSVLLHTGWLAGQGMLGALGHADFPLALVLLVNLLLAALSVAGATYILVGIGRRTVRHAARWCAGKPGRRAVTVTAGLAVTAGVVAFWTATGQFSGW